MSSKSIDLSVIITCHSEGILLHRTLASIDRAIQAVGGKYSVELVLHVDNPTPEMSSYIKIHETDTLKGVAVYQNAFRDLGLSRNFAIQKAHGKYIATIDADDLMSANWLSAALDYLEQQPETTVAHSEVTVEFEGVDSLIIKHGEIDLATDALLSVYANRWNSVIVAPRKLLLKEPYAANSPGYGYEDWHLNCRLIALGVHNVLIPETAIFVRRKTANSEWLRQVQSMAVLRKNPLLDFKTIRAIPKNPFNDSLPSSNLALTSQKDAQQLAKDLIKRYPFVHKVAKRIKLAIKQDGVTTGASYAIPDWLKKEWRALHSIEKQIFPSRHLLEGLAIYDTITDDHKIAGGLYKKIIDSLRYDTYDYLLFVPWLVKGGADQYAINYANTIADINPEKRVLVVATLPVRSLWQEKLSSSVDFLDFGNITQQVSNEIRYRLMNHLIENGNITHLHIINSEFGYDFVRLHENYVKSTDKKIIVTSFSQSIDSEGRLYGYSHTHVPFVYEIATVITSDNQAVIKMWEHEYGFDSKKLIVHRQPVSLPSVEPEKARNQQPKVLWAARIAPEKQPELVNEIGRLIDHDILVDMYGSIEKGSEKSIVNLPNNVTYRGGFDGFSSLPLENYSIYLYTSLFDGMPNAILDAAKNKLAIIASSVGGIPEFVDESTGIVINDIRNPQEYADAINQLVHNKTFADKLANNAYGKITNQYSPEQYKDNIKRMLEELNY